MTIRDKLKNWMGARTTQIVCDEELDISKVSTFHRYLSECLASTGELEIDASQLTRIDGAGLQLLVAFINAAKNRQSSIRWTGTSEALQKAAQHLGLSSTLELTITSS